jgi:hypothetical protein
MLGEFQVLETHFQLLIRTLQVLDVVMLHDADRKNLVIVILQNLVLLDELYDLSEM